MLTRSGKALVLSGLILAFLIAPAAAGFWDDLMGGSEGGEIEILGSGDPSGIYSFTLDPTTPVTVGSNGYFSGFVNGEINGSSLRFELSNANIQVNLRGADESWTKTLNGNYVKYSSSNIDIEYTVFNGWVKQNITLKKKPYPTLSIDLTNETGWLWLNDGSNVSLYDDFGEKRLSLGVPYAVDGKGNVLVPGIRVDSNNRVFFINGSDIISAQAPVLIDPLYTVGTGTGSDGTTYTSERHIARTSNGTLWAAWKGTSNAVSAAYSYNGGSSWTYSSPDTLTANAVPVAIVTDSQGGVYLFATGKWSGDSYNRVYLYYRNETHGWTTRKALTSASYTAAFPAPCVNSTDYIYMVYTRDGAGTYDYNKNLFYGVLAPGPSRSYTDYGEIEDRAGDQYTPTCVITPDDNLITTWYGQSWGATNYQMAKKYTLSTNSWAASETVWGDADYSQYEGAAAVNQSGYVYNVWRGKGFGTNENYYAVVYSVRSTGGSWSASPIRLDVDDTYHDSTPCVGLDRGDNVSFAWMGTGMGPSTSSYNILMRNLTISTNTLAARTIITGTGKASSRNDYSPNLHNDYWPLCQKRPNIGWQFIYSNQTGTSSYQITFANSTDITWGSCVVPTIEAVWNCTPSTIDLIPTADVTCTDLTNTTTPTSWAWKVVNASDGVALTSTVKNPIFNVSAVGQYHINLTVSDGATTDSWNVTNFLLSRNSAQSVDFNVTPLWGNRTTPFAFVDLTSCYYPPACNITAYLWNFYDGNTSASQNVTGKLYPCAQDRCKYDVTLYLNDSWGTPFQVQSYKTMNNYTTIYGNATPTVTFTANVTSGAQPLPVGFTATSYGNITVDKWSWDLGDSNTSTLQNPSNTYWDGTYTVSLTATNYTLGQVVITKTSYITVTAAGPPTADFSCSPLATLVNGSIACVDESTGGPTTWDWSSPTVSGQQALFDGNITTQNPTFFPRKPGGYFSLTLIACNPGGCSTMNSGPRYIWVQKYSHTWWGGW